MSFFRGLWGNNSRHKKLCEEWGLANSCESVDPSTSSGSCSTTTSASTSSASASSCRSGTEDAPENHDAPETLFELKYLGSTLVESPNSEKETAEAIKTVLSMAKASGKKLPRVSLAVSLEGIRMTNLDTDEEQLRVSIYSISYCSADGRHGQVFAFISSNLNETLECHAFMCPKRKVAQNVAITVSRAFNSAYELWQLSELQAKMARVEDKGPNALKLTDDEDDDDEDEEETDKESTKGERQTKKKDSRGKKKGNKKNLHLDLSESNKVSTKDQAWVSFEDEITGGVVTCQRSEGGIQMKPLKSPSSPTASSIGSNNNQESTSPMNDSWQQRCTESRPLDVVCSS